MWIEHRIFVIKTRDKTDGDNVVGHCVDERAAEFFVAQRIAHRVRDRPRFQTAWWNFPEFLDADRVDLRLFAFVEF